MVLSLCFLWKDPTRLIHTHTNSLTRAIPDSHSEFLGRHSALLVLSLLSFSSLCFSPIASHYSSSRHEKRDLVGGEIPLISVLLLLHYKVAA